MRFPTISPRRAAGALLILGAAAVTAGTGAVPAAFAAPAKTAAPAKVAKVAPPASTPACLAVAPLAPEQPLVAPDAPARLLRFPAIHGDTVVFCHGGDLWKVSAEGGTATRLTAHPGQEFFPRFSPDGKWLAFTGQYDGDEQVYVMPAAGGVPRQLTFYPAGGALSPLNGSDNMVYGWTPDGKNVLFRSSRDANAITRFGTLYTVPFEGGFPKPVGMPNAGAAAFSPDGSKLVYSPLMRDFRAWKRYRGGKMQQLSIYDLKTGRHTPLAPSNATQRDPVWLGDSIYFVSDKDATLNIWRHDLKTGKTEQVTREKTWDIRWASADPAGKRIVFELAGEIVIFDPAAGDPAKRFRKLAVSVPHDGLATRPRRVNAGSRVEQFAAAPGGKRVAITARGDLFTAPVEKGFSRNHTNTSDAHERHPAWSPDGKTLAFISDKTGEDQIWLQNPKTTRDATPLTTALRCQINAIQYSPDGKFIVAADAQARLWLVPTGDDAALRRKRGAPVLIVQAPEGNRPAFDISADSTFVAYSLNDAQDISSIHIYDTATGKHHAVTDPLFDAHSPAFSPDGKFLWFLSRREFAPQFSTVEWNFAGNKNTVILGLLLRKNVENPFGPQFDDDTTPIAKKPDPDAAAGTATGAAAAAKSTAKKNTAGAKSPATAGDAKTAAAAAGDAAKPPAPAAKPAPAKPAAPAKKAPSIDFDGLAARVVRVPVAADNYGALSATDKALLYVKTDAPFYGRGGTGAAPRLMLYDIKARKESTLLAGAGGYSLAPDYSHLVVNAGGLKSLEPRPGASPRAISTDALHADSVPAAEWAEIFREVWRKYRDHFYVRNMHGYDWEALGRQYRALLPHVTHRADLSYVLTDLISELNIGHAYIMGGEYYHPQRPRYGLPGARLELDPKTNLYRIAKIYRGQNEEPRYRSPLTEPGLDARQGDYILAIDGHPITGTENIYARLRDRTTPITLTLSTTPPAPAAKSAVPPVHGRGTPAAAKPRQVTYVPVESESQLRYLDTVLANHDRVTKATGGKVGYLHIPDMGGPGAYEFIKWYYPQIRKEGLVVDGRGNRGGNISQWIIMRLNQRLLGTRFGGVARSPDAYPGIARHGHQVALINESAGSDGDIFPYYFRAAGLGPLIGKRTWGGVVGISGVGPLLDGGSVTVPLRGTNDASGRWIIENTGVRPDIEVENTPESMAAGRDLQLERGIAEVQKRMRAQPKKWPARPADPVKTQGKQSPAKTSAKPAAKPSPKKK